MKRLTGATSLTLGGIAAVIVLSAVAADSDEDAAKIMIKAGCMSVAAHYPEDEAIVFDITYATVMARRRAGDQINAIAFLMSMDRVALSSVIRPKSGISYVEVCGRYLELRRTGKDAEQAESELTEHYKKVVADIRWESIE